MSEVFQEFKDKQWVPFAKLIVKLLDKQRNDSLTMRDENTIHNLDFF